LLKPSVEKFVLLQNITTPATTLVKLDSERVDHRCFSRAWAWHKIWRLAWLRFVIIATVTLHRYWGYPQAAQLVQYTFLVKNLAAAGGLILLFATGAGRFSLDNKMAS